MSDQMIPAGDSGSHTIRWQQMMSVSGFTFREFERSLLDEARERRLEVSCREDRRTGDMTIYWRPERGA